MGDGSSGYKVLALEVLKGQSRVEEARDILTRVAKQVEPLMAKYKWRVPLLAEFLPKNPGLLGLNYDRGQKILIRLRPHNDPGSFMDMESILGTMLHELVHNEISEHSDRFYTRLEELTAECEQLMVKGLNALTSRHIPYEGEGHTLGGGGGGRVDSAAVRAARAAAAERRRQRGAVVPGGGQRLGGGPGAGPLSGKESLRERIRSAAEKRALDSARCRTATQQADAGPSSGAKDGWACALCTFRNPGGATKCGVCDSPRGAATQDASQGLDDVFIDLVDDEEEAEGKGDGDKKLPAPAAPAGVGASKGNGAGDKKLPLPPPASAKGGGGGSNGGGGVGGGETMEEEGDKKKKGGWRCEGTGVGCGLLNEEGVASCARCGHTRPRPPSSSSSSISSSSDPFGAAVGRKRPLSPSVLDVEGGGDEDAEEAMLAAALAASVREQQQQQQHGADDEGEDAALARALAASAAAWRCGACTYENVGDGGGCKCSLCGTARGDGDSSGGSRGGAKTQPGVVDLTGDDD